MHQQFRLAAALALSAVLAGVAAAQQSTTSDAAIQSNVLKGMAADNRLASQQIQTTTAFGTVTISGSVPDEATRNAAEQVVAHTAGVKKVVDQLTIGATGDQAGAPQSAEARQAANEQAGMDALNEANGAAPQQTTHDGAVAQTGPRQVPQQIPQTQPPQAYPMPNADQQVGQVYPQHQPYPPQLGYPQPQYPQPQYPQQGYPQQQGLSPGAVSAAGTTLRK